MKRVKIGFAALGLSLGVMAFAASMKNSPLATFAAKPDNLYLRGNITINGTKTDRWNTYDDVNTFVYDSNTELWSLTISLTAGDAFKINNGTWGSWEYDGDEFAPTNWIWFSGTQGNDIVVNMTGVYTINLYKEWGIQSITATGIDYSDYQFHIRGSGSELGSWAYTDACKFTDDTANSGSLLWKGLINQGTEFGFNRNQDKNQWAAYGIQTDILNGTFTSTTGEDGGNFYCNMTGHYAMSFNVNTCKLSIDIDTDYYYLAVGETHYPLVFNSYGNQFQLTEVTLNYGDELYLIINGVAKGYSDLQNDETYGECVHMFAEGSDNAIKIKSSSKYEFYYKNQNATPANVIWAQIDSQIEAGTWAKNFLDNTICTVDANQSPIGDPTFGEGWSWTLLASSYNDLTNGAKNYIYAAGETMTDETQKAYVAEAVRRYDFIIMNHESETFYRFIKNSDNEVRNASSSIRFSPIVDSIENNASIVVVVFVGLAAVACASLFLAKRKEQ